jgi:hypothetical protein
MPLPHVSIPQFLAGISLALLDYAPPPQATMLIDYNRDAFGTQVPTKNNLKSRPSPFGGNEASGSGSQEFRVRIFLDPAAIDADSPYLGVYVQELSWDCSFGFQCMAWWPFLPECNLYSFTMYEWFLLTKDDAQDTTHSFVDTFNLTAKGKGCYQFVRSDAFFVPSGSEDFNDIVDHLEETHDDAKPLVDGSEDEEETPSREGPDEDPDPSNADKKDNFLSIPGPNGATALTRTGGFSAGVADADGDGVEEGVAAGQQPAATKEIVAGAELVTSANQGHALSLFWNFCIGTGVQVPVPYFN